MDTRDGRRDWRTRKRSALASMLMTIGVGLAIIFATASASAQETFDAEKQEDLGQTHSILQKTGLATLGLTGITGYTLLANKPSLFGEGRCKAGNPILGEFGCGGLTYLHAAFAVSTLGLYVGQEIVAGEMPLSPYDTGSVGKQGVMTGLRYTTYGLFAVQPILGFLAANADTFGMSQGTAKVLRTIHFGVGTSIATTYTANAVLQW